MGPLVVRTGQHQHAVRTQAVLANEACNRLGVGQKRRRHEEVGSVVRRHVNHPPSRHLRVFPIPQCRPPTLGARRPPRLATFEHARARWAEWAAASGEPAAYPAERHRGFRGDSLGHPLRPRLHLLGVPAEELLRPRRGAGQ